MRSIQGTLALLAVLALLAAPAWAENLAQSGGTSATDADIDRRLRFLEQRLDDSKLHGQIWWYGWLGINSGAMVAGGLTAGLSDDNDDTVKNATNAAKAAIGLTRMAINPLEARFGADKVRDLPEATREEKLTKLRAAEDQLKRNAERADRRWSLARHAGNVAINVAAGTFVALRGETGHAFEVGVGGFIGGLAFILTEPWGPASDWEDYQALTGGDRSSIDVFVSTLPEGGGTLNLRYQW
ncbi:MAG: hypothetical protein QNJ30_24415 [Kiloniellales bacterium]|nr:hypothetical protein [Kiloniellales bacterium]